MTREEVFECMKRNICEVLFDVNKEKITEEKELYALGANSLDRAEIINLVTEELELRIPRTELSGARKIGEIIDVLLAKLN